MAELDLSSFLKESSVADLDWLDVNEEDYHQVEALPKQNLDTRPDLEALWNREGESPSTYLVPNKVPVPTMGIDNPHTMGDMSQMHGPLSGQAQDIARVARYAMMQSTDLTRLRSELVKRFGLEALQQNRTVLASVLQERGLLGNYYIDAMDFPNCDQGKASGFVSKYASSAKFVLAKTACGDCSHSRKMADGTNVCGQFQKEIKVEIPFTDDMAAKVESEQLARGKTASTAAQNPKERIRQAYLGSTSTLSGVYAGQGVSQQKQASTTPQEAKQQLISASSLVRKKAADTQDEIDSKPVMAFLTREALKGHTQEELSTSLKVAFDVNLLARTKQYWGPIFREAGLYGVTYTKQASFDDCAEGADFLAKHNPSVRAIVAGDKCTGCIYNKTARCLMYGKPLVKSASDIVTAETLDKVVQEHQMAGRLAKTAASWGDSPAEALRAVHKAVRHQTSPQMAQSRMGMMTAFYGGPRTNEHSTSYLTKREIVKVASKYLNEGLYGDDLIQLLKTRFEVRDLVAAKQDLKVVLAEQGLQGVYYVDPTVYDDYGKGCDEAARLHGSRLVDYVKVGSKCASCIHQVTAGQCSKIRKPLVVEPPYVDKQAQQRAVLATGRSSAVSYESLINNATSTLAEFQMQNEMHVDIDAPLKVAGVSVELGTGKIKL